MGEGVKLVAFGAELICNAGSAPSILLATAAPTVHVEKKFFATIVDHVPIANIPPFGHCSIKNGPCIPVLPVPWADTTLSGITAAFAPVMAYDSSLQCAVGGKIVISDCNQGSVLVGVERPHASAANPSLETEAFYRFLSPEYDEYKRKEEEESQARAEAEEDDLKRKLESANDELQTAKKEGRVEAVKKLLQILHDLTEQHAEALKGKEKWEEIIRRGAEIRNRTSRARRIP